MPDDKQKVDQDVAIAAPQLFASPNLDSLKDHPVVGPHIEPNSKRKKRRKKRGKKKMRYAAYVRISSDDQIGNYSVRGMPRSERLRPGLSPMVAFSRRSMLMKVTRVAPWNGRLLSSSAAMPAIVSLMLLWYTNLTALLATGRIR